VGQGLVRGKCPAFFAVADAAGMTGIWNKFAIMNLFQILLSTNH
jgi:hypothetical protein